VVLTATAEPVRYSSSGVREQTAELSSSFLSDSEIARHFEPDDDEEDNNSVATPSTIRRYDPIQELSEPVSPSGEREHRPVSNLSEMLSTSVHANSNAHDDETFAGSRDDRHSSQQIPDITINEQSSERSPLLPKPRLRPQPKQTYDAAPLVEAQPDGQAGGESKSLLPLHWIRHTGAEVRRTVFNPKAWNGRKIADTVVLRPARTLPAVFLGVLLNLLDALSYGIILFPLGEEVFSAMGPDGVSMFYVSCIISQLVYSTGSIFRGGVGSEMIEVVPFFHKMTYMIMGQMGTGNPDALRATVITSYAMSSILTGLVFFGLGRAKLGTLVNFFPHSILTGCIGGVGVFLFITGIEVSARLDGNLELSKDVILRLFAKETVCLWIPPLILAALLLVIKSRYNSSWLVPAYYVAITTIFYIITTAVPSISMANLRRGGWVFDAPAAGLPFYNFYTHYKFGLVDWSAVWTTVPSQFALTFFGILHVPINVPNLAIQVREDNVNINRELILHGISNTLSGCVGSIQNYLVFVNSTLFMSCGGDSRLAGFMLAAATFGLWVAGPVVIGYVPVMVVGTLIYQLGIDLAWEAMVLTYGRLSGLEYFTIVVISFVMGLYDFVVGVAIGIGMACLVYVLQTSRRSVIRADFNGKVAESTVRRHPRQRNYLRKVGTQIRVIKLGSMLFFGSIVKVENTVRDLVDAEAFAKTPVRYLILDFSHVTGLDFSAAEAFVKMLRILHRRDVNLVLAGVTLDNEVGRSLQMVELFKGGERPEIFPNLNEALEACENKLLVILTEKQRSDLRKPEDSPPVTIPESQSHMSASPFDAVAGSPRHQALHEAATHAITETISPEHSKWRNLKQPLPLLLQAFQDLTVKNEDFWFRITPYFTRREFIKGQILYKRGDKPDGFYLLQSGILRAEYWLEQGAYHESIAAGTTCGELPFFSETKRTSSVTAEIDCIAWLLTPEKWQELQDNESDVATELLKVGMKLSAERMSAITSYVLITAS
jgi:SulP family sulfate permease